MNILITSLLAIMLPTSPPGLLSVTGPSSAKFKIAPIAAKRGAILFKTYHYINAEGAHAFRRTEFGWLVVSAHGIWEEVPHVILDPKKMPDREEYLWKKLSHYQDEFDRDFNWSSPPGSVQRLLKKYGFTDRHKISQKEGQGIVTWAPRQVCKMGKCRRGAIAQRSLHGLRNVRGEGKTIRCSFYYAGVALFENDQNDQGDEEPHGADFDIPGMTIKYMGKVEKLSIEIFEIDAISIIR